VLDETPKTPDCISPLDTRGGSRPSAGRAAVLRPVGWLLLVTLCIGLPIRLVIISRSVMVSRDTVTFIWYAQAMADDPLAAMRQHDQHPLYPAMVLGAHRLIEMLPVLPASLRADPIRSWTTAAIGVSLLGGLAVIAAIYLLASRLFDPQTGLLAALLASAAAEFCQLSADGLTDMPHLAIYLTAVWAALRGFHTARPAWFLLVGLLGGAGYLMRPEGAEPAVVAVALLTMPYFCSLGWRRRLAGIALVLAGSALVASPYMMVTGKLVQKKSIWKFLNAEPAASRDVTCSLARVDPLYLIGGSCEGQQSAALEADEAIQAGAVGDVPKALLLIGEKWVRSLRVTFLIPFIAWLWWRRRFPADRTGVRVVQAAAGLHLAIVIALIVQFDYWELFSLRHVLVLTGLALPFVAAGMIAILESLPERRQGVAALLLGFGLIAPTLPWMFEVRHRQDAHFRSAAAWMRENTPQRPRVLTERFRMAFYADADYIPGPLTADVTGYLAQARHHKPDWIAFDERRILRESPTFFTDLEQSLVAGESLQLARIEINKLRGSTRRVLVYHYRPPDRKAPTGEPAARNTPTAAPREFVKQGESEDGFARFGLHGPS